MDGSGIFPSDQLGKRKTEEDRYSGVVFGKFIQNLVVPVPPRSNTMYRNMRGMTVKTKEVKNYQILIQQIYRAKYPRYKPQNGDISIYLWWYRKEKRGDLDGRIKVILDALNGFSYVDDKQITQICAYRIDDDPKPRMEVLIESMVLVDVHG